MPGQRAPNGQLRLTYADIAQRLGISGDNARVLVRRRGWFRIIPNRKGQPTIVLVSEADLDAEQQNRKSPHVPPASADNGQAGLSELVALLDRTQTKLVAAERRADAAEQRAERAEQGAQEATQRADRLEAEIAAARSRARWARLRAAWRGD